MTPQDFLEQRSEEIEEYFLFLHSIIERRGQLSLIAPSVETKGVTTFANDPIRETVRISNDVINSLKANCYLLLYNLVEATIRKAIIAIDADIQEKGHDFDELHEDLRKHIAHIFRKSDSAYGNFRKNSGPLSKKIIRAGFDPDEFLSGNVHHESLVKLAKKFGFSVEINVPLVNEGILLKVVKDKRNILAHGELSFPECGKETAIDELLAAKSEIFAYLKAVLNNIEIYRADKGYLDAAGLT